MRAKRNRGGKLTWRPVLHGSKVRRGRRLAVLEGLHGPAAEHGDGQAGRAADGLLAGGDHSIQIPAIKIDLLAGNTADAVDDDERVGRDLADQGRQVLQLAQHAGGGVDVGDGDGLVALLGQRLLDLGQLGPGAHGRLELGHVGAVHAQAVGKAVAEVAGPEHEDVLAGLDQVGSHEIPAQRARAGDDEGLGGGVGGLEELAQHRQRLAEGCDKARANMALAVFRPRSAAQIVERANTTRRFFVFYFSPKVTHGLQNGIVKLDGPRDQERRVRGLGRHFSRGKEAARLMRLG